MQTDPAQCVCGGERQSLLTLADALSLAVEAPDLFHAQGCLDCGGSGSPAPERLPPTTHLKDLLSTMGSAQSGIRVPACSLSSSPAHAPTRGAI